MKNIAIIPARSGSKGMKDKNIKNLNGIPLIAYTIKAALQSKCFDTVFASTDSEIYAEIAQKYGAEVPFLRSDFASTDTASSWDVVRESLGEYKKRNISFDTFMILQPTSPLRNSGHIVEAYKLYNEKMANAVVSVCEVNHSPLYCNTLPESLKMDDFISQKIKKTRRQDLPIYYRLNGAIYISDVKTFLEYGDIFKKDCYAYIMNKSDSIDIDDIYDFAIAETLMRTKGNGMTN